MNKDKWPKNLTIEQIEWFEKVVKDRGPDFKRTLEVLERVKKLRCGAHFEQAVKDSERLEWLVANLRGVIFWHQSHTLDLRENNWRDAIDEAMKND